MHDYYTRINGHHRKQNLKLNVFIFLHSNKENKFPSPLPSMPQKKSGLFELKKKSLKLLFGHMLIKLERGELNMNFRRKK